MSSQQPPTNSIQKLTERLDVDFALRAAGLGVWEIDPTTNQVFWDQRCRALVGLEQDAITPLPEVIQFIHPDDLAHILAALQQAMTPQSGGLFDETFRTLGADDGKLRWVRFWGQGQFTAEGELFRFAGVAQEVTQQVLDRQKLEISEAKLRSLIGSAPAAIGLFVGPDLILENLNQTFLEAMGKGPRIEGLPLHEAMPELVTEGQPFLSILKEVYTTGVPFSSPAALVKIEKDGVLIDHYFNISYTPLYDQTGQIYAILDIAVDVTQQIHDQQALKESQARLESIIELTQLGVYSIDLTTNQLIKSPRLATWYELPERTDVASSLSVIQEKDRQRISQVLAQALEDGSPGYYNVEYGVISALTGQKRVLRTTGQLVYNPQGQPLRIDGSVLDITAQREQQRLLEQQIQQRTEDLAAANEELAASNEELLATNEDYAAANQTLAVANQDLLRSNQNLEQFTYIASHDLQEPLRKIQQFGDLLKTRLTGLISGEELTYLERMQSAAHRMSMLIKDLLAFSRIATTQAVTQPVLLNEMVSQALESLSMVIEESGAQLEVDDLPMVQGDRLQLSQLFQNLLANALKFRHMDPAGTFIPPRVRIQSHLLSRTDLPPSIKPARYADRYHLIEVIDNGIGFDEKYLDRIFQVFQRLHSKNEFAGTGVGLAIVEKVVTNHGGVLTARSQPGQGATFCVYLPA